MSNAIKGLMIKDINLLKGQKNFFLSIIAICVIVGIFHFEPTFLVSYVTIMFSFFTLSTLSYDEYENGMAYLFTLPISKKEYVMEKYLLGFLLSVFPCIIITVLSGLIMTVKGNETVTSWDFWSGFCVFPVIYLILAIEIPMLFQFGPEKSKIATLSLLGVAAILIISSVRLYDAAGLGALKVMDNISNVSGGVMVAAAAAVFVILVWISYKISCGIVEKKQF